MFLYQKFIKIFNFEFKSPHLEKDQFKLEEMNEKQIKAQPVIKNNQSKQLFFTPIEDPKEVDVNQQEMTKSQFGQGSFTAQRMQQK